MMERSILSITREFGVYGPPVLLAEGFLRELPRVLSGQPRRYLISRELPSNDEFAKISVDFYSLPIVERVNGAFSEFEELAEEMALWYTHIPRRLIRTEKSLRIAKIAELLLSIEKPEIPYALQADPTFRQLRVAVFPEPGVSRTTRHRNAVLSVRAAILTLKDDYKPGIVYGRYPADEWASKLASTVSLISDVEYPTRYS